MFALSIDEFPLPPNFLLLILPGIFGGYNPTGWVNYGEYR